MENMTARESLVAASTQMLVAASPENKEAAKKIIAAIMATGVSKLLKVEVLGTLAAAEEAWMAHEADQHTVWGHLVREAQEAVEILVSNGTPTKTEASVESRAETIIWGIRNLPVPLEDKMAVLGMVASAGAWMGEEDAGTVAEAIAEQASNIVM